VVTGGLGAPEGGLAPGAVCAQVLPDLPEVGPGEDLAALIHHAALASGVAIGDEDVVVVASKVVAKAEDRFVRAAEREAALLEESLRVVAGRTLPDGRTTLVVRSRSGPVLANAGVDASDVPPGTVLLLPTDPDASARALRARLAELVGAAPAVLVTDTSGRPWRDGVSDFALGAAGLVCLDDARGRLDRFGRPLEVTVRAVADEVAGLADLVKGKGTGTPVAVVRGLGHLVTAEDGPGARPCVRDGPGDWFLLGHVEAVRASLGLRAGEVAPPPVHAARGCVRARVDRAVEVARAGDAPPGLELEVLDGAVLVRGPAVAAGAMAQRLVVALWAESLSGAVGSWSTSPPGARVSVPVLVTEPPQPSSSTPRGDPR
jgi:coenzyme F420-0:L-glutamate ligase/coenzyme F420-1:gamma-L-glutamate ligase